MAKLFLGGNMFIARKISFLSFVIIALIFIWLIFLLSNEIIYFDYFYCFLTFAGIYLLIKTICYCSDSSFFFGSILFVIGIMKLFEIYDIVWTIYPIILTTISFLTYTFFDSKLMKIAFFCSLPLDLISIFIYFLS